jgi:phosphoribosylformylglycinamidine cyclo-ligase
MGVSYRDSGVDIDRANLTKKRMAEAVRSTYGPEVLGGHGNFGGLFDAGRLQAARRPVLVASTDGVGTKTMVAAAVGRYDTLGHDLVNHCVDDILVQGARPLFFLDYVASSRLEPERVLAVIGGLAEACRAAGCALLGGETAEMPGVYQTGELDLVGTIVGWVEGDALLDGATVVAGDVLVGLPSTGLHTNGFSLARRVFEGVPLDRPRSELSGATLADVLLAPHRNYLAPVTRLFEHVRVKALAHITGGGFYDNIPRVLPPGTGAEIELGTWPVLPIFKWIQSKGQVTAEEMYHVFNMGIGMIAILSAEDAEQALSLLPGDSYRLGQIVPGDTGPRVTLR